MKHPFQVISANNCGQVFFLLLVVFIVLSAILWAIPLKPSIVEFELDARQVIKSWDGTAKMWAAFSLGLDFLYLVIYSTTFGLGCIWVSNGLQTSSWQLANIGILLAWGQWLAALLDVIENIALLRILFNSLTNSLAQTAKWFAIGKFSLIGLGLLYVLIGGAINLRK